MKKSELKENIVNINKLLRSDNYQAVQPKPSKDKMTTREEVAYQEEINKSMKC